MPGLQPCFTDIVDFRFCASVIGVIKISFLIQHLAVQDSDSVSFTGIHSKFDIARHFLPEV